MFVPVCLCLSDPKVGSVMFCVVLLFETMLFDDDVL